MVMNYKPAPGEPELRPGTWPPGGDEMMDIEVILPEQKTGLIGELLVELTRRIAETAPDIIAHGLLGGEFGYGANFENETFMMRPECWCDAEDCPRCAGEVPNFLHKTTGFEVEWYKYIGRSMKATGDAEPIDVFNDCFASLRI